MLLAGCGGQGSPPTTPTPTPPASPTPAPTPAGPLNVILIVADDLGFGDLSSFGSPTIKTPNLDRMASEGIRLTQFTVPSPVCAPSRASLMTGRYPARTGIHWNPPDSLRGRERTMGDLFREQGYATGMVGKWHLGFEHDDLPVFHGFDFYYGLPYGEDPDGFYLNDAPTNDTVGFDLLAAKYTDEAVQFMRRSQGRPFFLYLAHRSPHTPLFASDQFLGKSAGRPLRRRGGRAGLPGGRALQGLEGDGHRPQHPRGLHQRQRALAAGRRVRLGRAVPRGQGLVSRGRDPGARHCRGGRATSPPDG